MMKNFLLLLLSIIHALAQANGNEIDNIHLDHAHDRLVDGEKLEVDLKRFERFIEGLAYSQIAIVSVKGMVCDFCARGIEKTFKRDSDVTKVDVDLSNGKVLIAFKRNRTIDFDDIKEKILANGQNATDLKVLII